MAAFRLIGDISGAPFVQAVTSNPRPFQAVERRSVRPSQQIVGRQRKYIAGQANRPDKGDAGL